MSCRKILRIICLLASIGLLIAACSPIQATRLSSPGRELQWPALPLEPKIQWEKEIRNYQDLGIKPGFWKRVWGFIAGEVPTDIVKPYGIYSDDKQRLFVADIGAGIVHLFDIGAGRYSIIEDKDAPFRTPVGITGDGEGNVYITDSGAGVIYRYNIMDESLKQFTTSKITRPTGIAYNKVSGLLYVSDTSLHQVIAIDRQGKERFRFGGRGTGPGQFNFPTDIAVDSRGRVIVTDALNARIQLFSPEGRPLGSFGNPGDSSGHFAKPKGVAVDSEGHIYVCDALFDSVQIFDDTGLLLLDLGESGGKPGQFWMPSGMHIDGSDYIYVADTYNKRVQVFKYLK